VFHDLRPYICTYPKCDTGNQLYDNWKDWSTHERWAHSKIWRCAKHPLEVYSSLPSFKQHLHDDYGQSLPESELARLISESETVSEDVSRDCPFCLWNGAEDAMSLQTHIATHLQRIALFALPRSINVRDASSVGDVSLRSNVIDHGSQKLCFQEGHSVTDPNRKEDVIGALQDFSSRLSSQERVGNTNPEAEEDSTIKAQYLDISNPEAEKDTTIETQYLDTWLGFQEDFSVTSPDVEEDLGDNLAIANQEQDYAGSIEWLSNIATDEEENESIIDEEENTGTLMPDKPKLLTEVSEQGSTKKRQREDLLTSIPTSARSVRPTGMSQESLTGAIPSTNADKRHRSSASAPKTSKSSHSKHSSKGKAQEDYLSFIFIVNELPTNDDPNNGGPLPRLDQHNRWLPPDVAGGYHPQRPGRIYRWRDGIVEEATEYRLLRCISLITVNILPKS